MGAFAIPFSKWAAWIPGLIGISAPTSPEYVELCTPNNPVLGMVDCCVEVVVGNAPVGLAIGSLWSVDGGGCDSS